MKLPNFRLSTRITIAAIVMLVAGAMALIFIEEARLRDVYLSEQRANLEQGLQAEKLRLSHAINTLRQDVLFLSNTPPVSGIVRATLNRGYDARDGDTRAIWEARLQQIFSAFLVAHPDYFQVRYIGVADGGRELVRVDNRAGKIEITPPDRLQAKGDRDYFKATLGLHSGEVSVSEFNLNREWGAIERPLRPSLRVSTPVFTPSGQIFGMVVINMDASYLLASATSNLPAGALTYITNMGGEYLLHPDARRSFGSELGGKDNITTDFPFLETMFNQQASEHLPLQATATKAGTQYLAAERIHFDPGDPARFLMLTYHIPHNLAAQNILRIPARHIIGGLMAMLLSSGIVLLVLRRTFAPLELIAVAAEKIAVGNHDVLLPQKGSGEIGSLANAFGVMQAKLSRREHDIRWFNAWLEDRVKERTIDLKLAQQETEAAMRLHKAVVDTAIDGFWMTDAMGNLLEANRAYAEMSGYPLDELVNMHISQLEAIEQSPEDVHARIAKVIAQGYDRFETRHRHKDGREIDIEVSATYMADSQQFSVFCRDITERKRAETQQAKSMSLLQTTLESANDAILVVDLNSTWVLHNQRFVDLWHITDEIIAAGDDRAALSYVMNQLEDPDGFLNKVRELYAAPEANSFDILEFKDGKTIERYSIPQHIGGQVVGRVWSFRDITGRKHDEEKLRIAAAAFETQDAIMITGADGNIVRVNRAFSEITGYSPEEVLGKSPDIMNAEQGDRDPRIEMLQQSIHNGSWAGEIWDKRKNGQIYPKWMTVTAIKNERQETTHCVSIFSDITARKQIGEARLRESEERFRGTLEQAAVGIAHASLDGHFQQVNQKFCEIVGYARDELIKMNFHDITFSADLDEYVRYIQQLLAGEVSTFSMEKRYVRKDQSLVWVSLTVSLLRDADGTPKYTIGVIEDISERKQADVLVQQFGSLLQGSFNEIYLFDADSLHFLLTSEGAEKNLGYSDDELNRLTPLDIQSLFTRESFEQLVAPLRNGEQQSLFFETVHRRKDGTTYPVEVRLQLMQGECPVFMAVIQDVTERRQAEAELNQSRNSLRDLVAQSEMLREEERKQIAREVHDELGQLLTALRMNVSLLRIEFGGHSGALLKIKGITELLDQSIQCVRDVVTNLRPAALDMGIAPAIRWLCDEFTKHTGTPCVLSAPEEEIHLDEILAVTIFRVVQESLTNVARYAEASKVEINIEQDADNFSVTVNDNGKGFDYMATSNRKSFGLLGMRERAMALGGVVNIYSAQRQGTQVFLTVPNTRIITNTEGNQP